MNFLEFLPILVSLYLIVIAELVNHWLERMVKRFEFRNSKDARCLERNKELIIKIAMDWGDRVVFLNAMPIAFVTLPIIFEKTKDDGGLWVFTGILLTTFVALGIWSFSHNPADWEKSALWSLPLGWGKLYHLTIARICNIYMFTVNVTLGLALLYAVLNNPPAGTTGH